MASLLDEILGGGWDVLRSVGPTALDAMLLREKVNAQDVLENYEPPASVQAIEGIAGLLGQAIPRSPFDHSPEAMGYTKKSVAAPPEADARGQFSELMASKKSTGEDRLQQIRDMLRAGDMPKPGGKSGGMITVGKDDDLSGLNKRGSFSRSNAPIAEYKSRADSDLENRLKILSGAAGANDGVDDDYGKNRLLREDAIRKMIASMALKKPKKKNARGQQVDLEDEELEMWIQEQAARQAQSMSSPNIRQQKLKTLLDLLAKAGG